MSQRKSALAPDLTYVYLFTHLEISTVPAIPLLATRILVMVLLPPCDNENSSGVVVGAGGVPEGCRDDVRDMEALNCRPEGDPEGDPGM